MNKIIEEFKKRINALLIWGILGLISWGLLYLLAEPIVKYESNFESAAMRDLDGMVKSFFGFLLIVFMFITNIVFIWQIWIIITKPIFNFFFKSKQK